MRDDRVPTGVSLSHKIIVGNLQERAHCRKLVCLTIRSAADFGHCRKDRHIRPEEEPVTAYCGPIG